jgi:hypothetical protein
MVINHADFASLPEDGVPSVIMDNMTLSDDVQAASAESSSYVPPIDARDDHDDGPSIGPVAASNTDVHVPPSLVSDNSSIPATDICPNSGPNSGSGCSSSPSSGSSSSSSSSSSENVIWMDDIPIECSAVLDMDSTQVSPEMLLNGAAKNLKIPLGPDPVVISTHGNTKVSNYHNPTFWTCAFPTLFPYGTGGCDDRSPNLREWMNYLLTHRDPRFRQHYSFMFVGFNILNVREVCKQVRFTVSRPSGSKDPLTIKSTDLKKVFDSIKDSKTPSPRVNDPAFQKLQKQISMIGKNIEGSDFQKKYTLT